MAGKAAAPGTAVLLVTANVGSLFDDPENLQKNWLREFYQALGSFYFLHESLKNISQFDFKAKKYKKVTGKEIYSDTLESTPMLEKEKFPQDYFPECKWSRKGFIRTRWCLADCAFDLVNIHLFHDASNLVAWETSPSVYSGIRHKALGYVLDRIIDQRFEKASYFVFGDFNFRLDSKSVVETLCTKATMQTVRAADTNEVVKLIFRESDNDRKVMLQLEKKLFDYFNQEVFRDDNGTALLEFDKELSVFKDRLYELDISFPPSYPYSEDSSQGRQYMNTRCPAWCDRVLMSPSAKELILRSESEEKVVTYDHIGPSVCMGDHKGSDASATRGPPARPPCSTRSHVLRQLHRQTRLSATARRPAPHVASARTALRTSLTYLTVVSARVTSSRNIGIF
ncbi:inositol polyphosphate-5-phosphatase A isoform X8 [Tursiops truncatus]|uniref:inositol polyphosphate-5-phosphatase A isoform X8 n=1 Tax=Tursiops truncatus TaxID=9739 RepID=UPI003CCF9F64